MKTTYQKLLRESPRFSEVVAAAHALEKMVEKSDFSDAITASWALTSEGNVSVRMYDAVLPEDTYVVACYAHDQKIDMALAHIWGDLLQQRNHHLLQNLKQSLNDGERTQEVAVLAEPAAKPS